jgi:hypothetical protein
MKSHVKRFYMGKLKPQEIPCKRLREMHKNTLAWWRARVVARNAYFPLFSRYFSVAFPLYIPLVLPLDMQLDFR